jgi:hypothetical protein
VRTKSCRAGATENRVPRLQGEQNLHKENENQETLTEFIDHSVEENTETQNQSKDKESCPSHHQEEEGKAQYDEIKQDSPKQEEENNETRSTKVVRSSEPNLFVF